MRKKKLLLKRNEMLVCYSLLLGWWWKFVHFCSADKINSRSLNFHSVTDIGTVLKRGILEILVQTRLQTIIILSGDLKGEQCNTVTGATPVLAELQFQITNTTPTKLCKTWRATVLFSILKHDQQDATLYNTLYYCQRSSCFERVFRSSSGAQICT